MTKQLLVITKPTKPVSEMTPDERRELADRLFDKTARAEPTSAAKSEDQ